MSENLKIVRDIASQINLKGASNDTKRQFRMLSETKQSDNKTVIEEMSKIGTAMSTVYNTASIPYDPKIIKSIKVEEGTKELRLDKHLHKVLASSDDPQERLYVWKQWRDQTGRKVK